MNHLLTSLRMVLFTTVLLGVFYPLVVTALAQVFWPRQANGSIIQIDGKNAGSELLAQSTTGLQYFWPRPSAGSYATVASGASSAAATNKALVEAVQTRRKDFAQAHDISEKDVPTEMIYTSASGLDPHISAQSALVQMDRVAKARGFDAGKKEQLKSLIEHLTEAPQGGFLGQTRINVFVLNTQINLL